MVLGKSNEYCTDIVSQTLTSLQLPLSTILFATKKCFVTRFRDVIATTLLHAKTTSNFIKSQNQNQPCSMLVSLQLLIEVVKKLEYIIHLGTHQLPLIS